MKTRTFATALILIFSFSFSTFALGQDITLRSHTDSIVAVAYSPDGKLIATSSRDETIRVWDAATGKELHKLAGYKQPAQKIHFVDDKTLLTAGGEFLPSKARIDVWNVITGKPMGLREYTNANGIYYFELSPDGKRCAVLGMAPDTLIDIRHVPSLRFDRRITLESGTCASSMLFLENGDMAIGIHKGMMLFDTNGQKFPDKTVALPAVSAMARANRFLLLGGNGGVVIEKELSTHAFPQCNVDQLAFATNITAAHCQNGGKIHFLNEAAEEWQLPGEGYGRFALSPEGKRIAVVQYKNASKTVLITDIPKP